MMRVDGEPPEPSLNKLILHVMKPFTAALAGAAPTTKLASTPATSADRTIRARMRRMSEW